MARSENDEGIRVNVLLCDVETGKRMDVPGLVAIPSDRLDCFEKIAVLAGQLVAALNDFQRSPTRGTNYPRHLRELEPELKKLANLWDEPKTPPATGS
jgi:hypothetical protein